MEKEKSALVLVQKLTAHKGKVWALDWSSTTPEKFISCGEDKLACVWSAKDLEKATPGEAVITQTTKLGDTNHTRSIRHVAWSPCGKYVLLASFDGQVTLWEEARGGKFNCVSVVEGHESEVKAVAWSPSGRYFASCGRDKNVMIWSLIDDGEDVECSGVMTVHTQDVKRVVWHPHLDILVSCSYDDTIKFFTNDIDDGDWATAATLTGHESTVWAVDFDASGNRLVSSSDDRTLKIWEKSEVGEREFSWSCVCTIADNRHKRPIYDVAWNKTNGLIATACGDNHIRVYREIKEGSGGGGGGGEAGGTSFSLVHEFLAHDSDVNCVKWHPKYSNFLASTGDDGLVKIWKLADQSFYK